MVRRILYSIAAILLVIGTLALYVAARVVPDLRAVGATLRSPETATVASIDEARARLQEARDVLDGAAAKVLGVVPIAAQNLNAVQSTLEAADPALEAAGDLQRLIDDVEAEPILRDGAVDLERIEELVGPLTRAEDATRELESVLHEERDGWLLPPLWDQIDELLERTTELRKAIARAAAVVPVMGPLLGEEERRDYAVLLLNNAELRGAGGITSGIGTLRADRGHLKAGPFAYYAEVAARTELQSVPAPPAYERRFARVGANTTIWVNVSYSPDIPDVGVVASRLFKVSTPREVDGVLLVDARGFTSLLPRDSSIDVPRRNESITAKDIPEYAYSGQYETFAATDPGRREALVDLGLSAFDALLGRGTLSLDSLERAGDAVLGGHIRLVSLDPKEAAALKTAGVSGDLSPEPGDSMLVTVQNVGADKLDYWIDRKLEHVCDITTQPARCVTNVTLTNNAPRDLSEYVAPRPNAKTKEFLEIYVPANAELDNVLLDDAPAEHFDEEMSGRVSVGLDVEIARGESVTASVGYYLPFDGTEYSLLATPQPLSRDARISLGITAPDGWIVEGPDGAALDSSTYRGIFDRPLRLRAYPDERTGFSEWWDALT